MKEVEENHPDMGQIGVVGGVRTWQTLQTRGWG